MDFMTRVNYTIALWSMDIISIISQSRVITTIFLMYNYLDII